MSALDNLFRIACRTLVVAFAAVAAPPCGQCSGRLRSVSEWARGPNRHGRRRDKHAIEEIAARDRLVQTKQLVRVRTIGHCIFLVPAALRAGCMGCKFGSGFASFL